MAQILHGKKLRQRGYAPHLSDSEVITMEIVGAFLGHTGDEAIWEYFRQHGLAWLPALGCRTTFSPAGSQLMASETVVTRALGHRVGG